jgi:hypothetical protein
MLHFSGADALHIDGFHLCVLLPVGIFGYLAFLPYLGSRTAISFSAVMVMLALAVLAGYGVKYLRQMVAPSWAQLVPIAACMVIICEYAIVPFPLWKVNVPQVYEDIRDDLDPIAVLDLPFGDNIKVYQYYQTVHEKKLIHGFLPRLPSFNRTFGENILLLRMLESPTLIPQDPRDRLLAEQAQDVMRLFRIRYIVVHKDYFASDDFVRVEALVKATLPVQIIAQDEHITAYRVEDRTGDAHPARRAYLIDFGTVSGVPAVLEGWPHEESSNGLTYAWSNAQESTLWLDLSKASRMKMSCGFPPLATHHRQSSWSRSL